MASSAASAIRATRGAFRDVASAQVWALSGKESAALHGKTLVYFNGAFSPPTRAHAELAIAALRQPGVDALWLDPEPAKPGKERWQDETLAARIEMCELLAKESGFGGRAGVGTLRRDLGPKLGQSAELFRTLRALVGPEGRLIWALGADVFEGMRYWREKAYTCLSPGDTCDGIILFARGCLAERRLEDAIAGFEGLPCTVQIVPVPAIAHLPADAVVSSTAARDALVAHLRDIADGASDADKSRSHAALSIMMLPSIVQFCLSRPEVCDIYKEQVIETSRVAEDVPCGDKLSETPLKRAVAAEAPPGKVARHSDAERHAVVAS